MPVEREIIGRFIDACVQDHAEAGRLLLAHPQLRNASWLGDEHLLNFLVIENFYEGVRFCLENGFDPNQPDGVHGGTPLIYACKLNYREIAAILLKSAANPNVQSEIDDNPIHCCIQNGNAEILDMLIAHGANANYMTVLGETVFDNWPNDTDKQSSIAEVLRKHNVTPSAR